VALSVPDLAVGPGEILALVGPNGAGKSTLLQVAALLRAPDAGVVRIGGERANRRNAARLRRRLGVVFQAPLLFDVSVLDNAASGLRFRGVGRREAAARARAWLDRFGVGGLARRSARTLSGGEAQRVALARAFAPEPEVLLLDEPFAALDAPTRAALGPELTAQLRATGTAAVVVTHDQAEALAVGDRLGVLLDGRLAQIGRPEAVAARPATAGVARFLGVANVLPGRVVGRSGGFVAVELGDGGAPAAVRVVDQGRFAVGERVEVALRANALSVLGPDGGPPGWNVLSGMLIEAAPLPFGQRLVVDVGGARARVRLVAEVPFAALGADRQPGRPVCLGFPPDAAYPMPAGAS